jgi:hypothetical protein
MCVSVYEIIKERQKHIGKQKVNTVGVTFNWNNALFSTI